MNDGKLLYYIVESSLHVGEGNSLGRVDMIIQRERHTTFPIIRSSSLKGTFRTLFQKQVCSDISQNNKAISLLFGPEKDEKFSGSLVFSDAHILLFPVKSMKGIYGWITCPYVLARFNSMLKETSNESIDIPEPNTVSPDSDLVINDNRIILDEFTFKVKSDESVFRLSNWISEKIIGNNNDNDLVFLKDRMKNIVVLSDDDFAYFVNYATELFTRTKINVETGSVKSTGLFTEEYLPSDTILVSKVFVSRIFNKEIGEIFDNDETKVLNYFIINLPNVIQIGKNTTIGKGIVKIMKGI